MSNRSRLLGVVLYTMPVLFAAVAAHAQDTNYWTLQYGTRGELLGGTVVGSAVDLSATFYNPGSLALVKDPKTILTANVFGMETIKVSSVPEDTDAPTSRQIGIQPSLFAGIAPVKWWGGRWAYSFLTRQKSDFRLTQREGLVIALPGETTVDSLSVGGEVLFDQYENEQWGGVTYSRPLSDNFGIGMTLYGAYRSQSRSTRQTVEAIGEGGYGASLLDWSDLDYSTFRMLAKLGLSADYGKTTLGFAFTTRSLPIFGHGTILINRVVIGDADLDGIADSRADVTFERDLDADYRSPFSFAVGGSHRWTDITVHATAEYFMKMDPYTVMETGQPQGSPGVTAHPATFQHALDEVFNWGVGVEKTFSEKTTAYLSFITDRSASHPVEPFDISVSTWDIYHVNGGVAFVLLGTDLTLGGGFAWGNAPLHATPDSEGILPATIEPSAVNYSRVKAILGIAL